MTADSPRVRLAVAMGLLLGASAGAAEVIETPDAGTSKAVADMDLEELVNVRVTPFDVSRDLDNRYRASNSVSGSSFDTPIRALPFAIQAFTEAFIEDQRPVNLFDVARYSPGVTYRSNDFNEGNANLAIRGFAVSGTAGSSQVLRDGFHGPPHLRLHQRLPRRSAQGPLVVPLRAGRAGRHRQRHHQDAAAPPGGHRRGRLRLRWSIPRPGRRDGPGDVDALLPAGDLLRSGQPLLAPLRRPLAERLALVAVAAQRAGEPVAQVRVLPQGRDAAAHAEARVQHPGGRGADRRRPEPVGRRRARPARHLERHGVRRLPPQHHQRPDGRGST